MDPGEVIIISAVHPHFVKNYDFNYFSHLKWTLSI